MIEKKFPRGSLVIQVVFQVGHHPHKRTSKTHPKHIFSRHEKNQKVCIFACFFLNLPPFFSKICDHHQKHTLFFQFWMGTPKQCTCIHCLVLKKCLKKVFHSTRMISTLKYKWSPQCISLLYFAQRWEYRI